MYTTNNNSNPYYTNTGWASNISPATSTTASPVRTNLSPPNTLNHLNHVFFLNNYSHLSNSNGQTTPYMQSQSQSQSQSPLPSSYHLQQYSNLPSSQLPPAHIPLTTSLPTYSQSFIGHPHSHSLSLPDSSILNMSNNNTLLSAIPTITNHSQNISNNPTNIIQSKLSLHNPINNNHNNNNNNNNSNNNKPSSFSYADAVNPSLPVNMQMLKKNEGNEIDHSHNNEIASTINVSSYNYNTSNINTLNITNNHHHNHIKPLLQSPLVQSTITSSLMPATPITIENISNIENNGLQPPLPNEIKLPLHVRQLNPINWPIKPQKGKFFVIKSFGEDDVHKSIKYNVWCSTERGNHKLNQAFLESKTLALDYKDPTHPTNGCPIYLFFSVNKSGCFCGMARLESEYNTTKSFNSWVQDGKWNGSFHVKWIYVKDIPNKEFKHIKLPNNDYKPVTFSRDTQEIPYEFGLSMLKIFNNYQAKTNILQDFNYYDDRENDLRKNRLDETNNDNNNPQNNINSNNNNNNNNTNNELDNNITNYNTENNDINANDNNSNLFRSVPIKRSTGYNTYEMYDYNGDNEYNNYPDTNNTDNDGDNNNNNNNNSNNNNNYDNNYNDHHDNTYIQRNDKYVSHYNSNNNNSGFRHKNTHQYGHGKEENIYNFRGNRARGKSRGRGRGRGSNYNYEYEYEYGYKYGYKYTNNNNKGKYVAKLNNNNNNDGNNNNNNNNKGDSSNNNSTIHDNINNIQTTENNTNDYYNNYEKTQETTKNYRILSRNDNQI